MRSLGFCIAYCREPAVWKADESVSDMNLRITEKPTELNVQFLHSDDSWKLELDEVKSYVE